MMRGVLFLMVRLSPQLDAALRLRQRQTGETRAGMIRSLLVTALRPELEKISLQNAIKTK
jgi:hypothetical protein